MGLSSVITHGNIRDEVPRDAADQAGDREFSIALSPIHDIFSDEDIQRKGNLLECMPRATHPCEAIVRHLLTSAYIQR